MSTLAAFTVSATIAVVFSLLLVLVLRRPLRVLLQELCGNEARARFWSVYWAATIVLAALFGLLVSTPLDEKAPRWSESPAVPVVLSGFRASLIAVLVVLGMMAIVLLRTIGRFESDRMARRLPGEPLIRG